jgi:hypothetical protein
MTHHYLRAAGALSRDATRGGVTGLAVPGQSPVGGKISPLSIDVELVGKRAKA